MPSSCVVIKTPFKHDGCTAEPPHVEYTYHREGACVMHKKMLQRYACREEKGESPSSFGGRDRCPKCDVERRKRRLQSPHLHKNRNKPSAVTRRKKDSISCCTV
ncbi:uncharacterized protein K444DRAFT_622114, partial [Hyaloscypha bicolor E]